jgi:CRP-like cAMP-binding protein
MSDPLAPLFEGLTPRQAEIALSCFTSEVVAHGTPVLLEGDHGGALLLVAEGELEIRTGDLELGVARAGDIIGEIGLFTEGVRTATVETNTEAELLVLTRDGYDELVSRANPVAARLERIALQTLVDRLRSVDARIAQLAAGTPIEHHRPSPSFFQRVGRLFGVGGAVRPPGVDPVATLVYSPLFDGVDPVVLIGVAAAFTVEAWRGGEFLCTEGEPGESLFLIVSGGVDVLIETQDERVEPLATLGVGDAFGMAGLVDNRPRTASCVTRGDAVTLRLDRAGWERVSGADDPAGRALRVAMVRALAESLSYANGQLALLDLTSQASDLTPLLMASAAVEAAPRDREATAW